jgi:hypothetical protein
LDEVDDKQFACGDPGSIFVSYTSSRELAVAPPGELDLPGLFPFEMLIVGSGGSGKEWLTKLTTRVEVFVLYEQVQ